MIRIIRASLIVLILSIFFLLFFPTKARAQIVINEFVPDSVQEWIEFYNASTSADYIKTYYIDDDTDFLNDSGSSAKKLLTNLSTMNPTFPTIDTSSFLNNSGDWVVLFDQNGVLIDQYQFTSDPGKDVSVGRYPDSTGAFSILAYSTKADANSAPPTPISTSTPTLEPIASPPPTPTPTPTKTPTPTPTPTKTPFPSPIKTPTVVPSSTPEVLGESNQATSETEITTKPAGPPLFAVVFIGLGITLVGVAIFMAVFKKYDIMRK